MFFKKALNNKNVYLAKLMPLVFTKSIRLAETNMKKILILSVLLEKTQALWNSIYSRAVFFPLRLFAKVVV